MPVDNRKNIVIFYCHAVTQTALHFWGLLRVKTMSKQANNVIDFGAVVRGIVTYAASSETIERAQSARFESRKIVADFVRQAHGMEWKKVQKPVKSAIESLAVGIVADKQGLLGVIKTCVEYGIMPTTLNADRLRKAKNWTDINGKIVPNTYGKVHTKEGAGQKAKPVELDASKIVTVAPAPTTTEDQPQTSPKVPSVKPVTPQKEETKVHPLTVNVSGDSEAPISAREHCGILLDQLFKNEAFRSEFAPILAMCLDSNVATVTRCLVEARDAMLNGKGVK